MSKKILFFMVLSSVGVSIHTLSSEESNTQVFEETQLTSDRNSGSSDRSWWNKRGRKNNQNKSSWRQNKQQSTQQQKQNKTDYGTLNPGNRDNSKNKNNDQWQNQQSPQKYNNRKPEKKGFFERFESYFERSKDNKGSGNYQGYRKGKRGRDYSSKRYKNWEGRWDNRGRSFRRNFHKYRHRDHIFDDNYWYRFRKNHNDWYFDNKFSWGVSPTWPSMTVWLPWGWNKPVYYYYEDDNVYFSLDPNSSGFVSVESNQNYSINPVELANRNLPISRNQADWMALGTFGIFKEENTSDVPEEYVTLAISKNGAVSGAYVNVKDNRPIQIRGAIDQVTQRIAWKPVGGDWPVMESGMYNLSQKESPLLVHFSNRDTKSRVLARIED